MNVSLFLRSAPLVFRYLCISIELIDYILSSIALNAILLTSSVNTLSASF